MKQIATLLVCGGLCLLAGCSWGSDAEDPADMKMLVLGMDGMDPILVERMMEAGELPNFVKLAKQGGFTPLGTAMPPESPVAWSNVISGATPGTHQIYDFIHRDPNPQKGSIQLYASISKTVDLPESWYQAMMPKELDWGDCRLQFKGLKQPVCLRRGLQFWDYLVPAGVDTSIYRLPANYPPPPMLKGAHFQCLCGMGTPDLRGSDGTFTCFTENLKTATKHPGGGVIIRVSMENDRAVTEIEGPPNSLKVPDEKGNVEPLSAQVIIVRDPKEPTVKITIGDPEGSGAEVVLRKGEWSDWTRFAFETGCFGQTVSTITKIYVKQVHPELTVYFSALQIDPMNPATPISTPPEFAAQVAETTGLGGMYTTGIPEDTKALRTHNPQVFNEDEFIAMVNRLVTERRRQYRAALKDFKSGFLFFYFGHTDQLAHIFWGDTDPEHPGQKLRPEQRGKYVHVVEDAYRSADEILGEAFKVIDSNDILMVMSDHGFGSFRRGFNVNTWLAENGYLQLRSTSAARRKNYMNIDFYESQAYAVGLATLYINEEGREKYGIVPPDEKRALIDEIAAKLLKVRDTDGTKVVDKVYIVEDFYPGADPSVAPDIIIGYARGYRGSWKTGLGGQPTKVIEDNRDRWTGDHMFAAYLVPGILVTNQKIERDNPTLSDIAPTILQAFGVTPPKGMVGHNIFGNGVRRAGELAAARRN